MMKKACFSELPIVSMNRHGLLPAFHRTFLSACILITGKNFLQPHYHDIYCYGSYYLPDRAISGMTAAYGLCTDWPDQNIPVPAFRDYAAIRPPEVHSGQYLLSFVVALISR